MSTLDNIRKKVRRLTATPSTLQLPNDEIDDYINTYYEQDMPADLKLWNLHETYTFYTNGFEDKYTLPVNTILGINPPMYIDGYESFYTQSNTQFFRLYPEVEYKEDVTTGDSTAGPYTFTLSNTNVTKRSFYVTAVDTGSVTRTIVDDPDSNPLTEITANLIVAGDPLAASVGTINYVTGAVSVTFPATIATGTTITAGYFPNTPSRPTAALFYDDYFILRPVPDEAYKIVIEAYVLPTTLLDSPTLPAPEIQQWWQLIAFGAALKVLEDRQDTEAINSMMPRYDEQKQFALHRTILQITPERTSTIYSDQLNNNFSSNQGGF